MAPIPIEDKYKRIKDHRERYRQRRKAEGRCMACGLPREGRSRIYCDMHLDLHLERCAQYRERRRVLRGRATELDGVREAKSLSTEGTENPATQTPDQAGNCGS